MAASVVVIGADPGASVLDVSDVGAGIGFGSLAVVLGGGGMVLERRRLVTAAGVDPAPAWGRKWRLPLPRIRTRAAVRSGGRGRRTTGGAPAPGEPSAGSPPAASGAGRPARVVILLASLIVTHPPKEVGTRTPADAGLTPDEDAPFRLDMDPRAAPAPPPGAALPPFPYGHGTAS